MSINDIPGLAALRTRMQWHQERQRVLAENVANSDTPGFKPKDLVEPNFDANGVNLSGSMGSLAMMRTSSDHIAPGNGGLALLVFELLQFRRGVLDASR